MADVTITPPTIELTPGKPAPFQATDSAGQGLAVTWTIDPVLGAMDPATGGPSTSVIYTAPSQIDSARTVTLTAANSAGKTTTAAISLTPLPAIIAPPAQPATPPAATPPAAGVSIAPSGIRLTGGQTVVFQARDRAGNALPVTWRTIPTVGTIDPPTGGPSISLTYTVPPQVLSPQQLTVIATSTVGDAGTAAIFLTPNPIEITPAKVELKHTQQQQFKVAVAGDPDNKVLWNISPNLGKIEGGLYTAPDTLDEAATVTLIASTDLGKQTATVTLTPPPWTGRGRNVLGAYVLSIFMLVFLLIRLWPQSLPDSATAKSDRLEAAQNVEDKAAAFTRAQAAFNAATQPADKEQAQAALERAGKERKAADDDLSDKRKIESAVASPDVKLWNESKIPRDIDLVLLVLLGGALGSFLHSARSFADFVGNKRMAGSWAWWYLLHPFTGAIMALVFYAAIRGGFLAITGGANMKPSDLSPFGVTAVAALVGMFSNQATQKLADVFDVVFKPSSGTELKNPLEATTSVKPTGGTTNAASADSSTAAAQAGAAPGGAPAKT